MIFSKHFPRVWRWCGTNGISRGTVNSCSAGGMKTGCTDWNSHEN